jgi:hypothetical protein
LRLEQSKLLGESYTVGRHSSKPTRADSAVSMGPSLTNPRLTSAARIAELISQEKDLHTADPNALALSLASYIHQGAFDKAHAAFTILSAAPKALEAKLAFLQRNLAEAGRLGLLLDWLMMANPEVVRRIAILTVMAEVGLDTNQPSRVLEFFEKIRNSEAFPPVVFGNSDYLQQTFMRLGSDIGNQLLRLKYKDLNLRQQGRFWVIRDEDLFEAAARVSDRIQFARVFLDRLYALRRQGPMRAEWEREIRITFCIDHIIADRLVRNLDKIISKDQVGAAFEAIKTSNGTLLTTFHGGYFRLTRYIYALAIEGGLTMGMRSHSPSHISAKEPRTALFRALRAIEGGNVVLMAPDAPVGTLSSSIQLAGVTLSVAEGAAFIAYGSRCNSAWFTVLRNGERFEPIIRFAPQVSDNESYPAFKKRWLSFYGSQIEGILTGDPRNLCLREPWTIMLGRVSS